MTQPSGWYDDPVDPSQLRYWDGVNWSSHITPKVWPAVEQSTIGMPYGVTPAPARQQNPGSQGAQGAPGEPRGYDSPQQGREQQGQEHQDEGPQGLQGQQQREGQGPQGGQWPAYGQPPGQFPAQQQGWQSHPSTTPDGVRLASWGLRLGARVLDGLFLAVLSLPFAGWFYYRYFVEVFDWSNDLAAQTAAGSTPVLALPPMTVLLYAFGASIVSVLVSCAYEVFFLSRSGATPGKKIVGISVRLRDRVGPPPMKSVLGRAAFYYGFSLVGLGIVNLLDCLWPLWDDKKQALHDKVAATNVVVGAQPERDA